MATTTKTTDDPRIEKVKEIQVYALYDEDDLIYVGATAVPLKTRLQFHEAAARCKTASSYDALISQYIRQHDPAISIEAIPYESETEAIEELGPPLNHEGGSERSYTGHQWTPEELDVLEEADNVAAVARELGLPYHEARFAASKLGLETSNRWTEEEIELLGTNIDKAIAEQIGRSAQAVWHKRKELGIDAYSSRNKLSRRTAALVYIDYHLHGYTHAEIADEIGVSRPTIGQLVRGDTYEGLDREALDELVEQIRDRIEPAKAHAAIEDEQMRRWAEQR